VTLTIQVARRRLATVWFSGAGLCFLVLLVISLFGRGANQIELWDWFLHASVPNLSLIIAVMVYVQQHDGPKDTPVDGFLYALAFWLSVFYLILLLLPLLVFPLTGKSLPELLETSRLWLAAVQGLVTGAMGAFFIRQ